MKLEINYKRETGNITNMERLKQHTQEQVVVQRIIQKRNKKKNPRQMKTKTQENAWNATKVFLRGKVKVINA